MKYGSDNTAPPHTIRLRGPCRLIWLRNGTQQADVRVHIPCELSPDLFELSEVSTDDSFVLVRNFGTPTGLDESQYVTLEFSGFEGACRVMFNGGSEEEVACVYEGQEVSVDVTDSLRQQNRFEVEFDSLPALAGEVQLVIE